MQQETSAKKLGSHERRAVGWFAFVLLFCSVVGILVGACDHLYVAITIASRPVTATLLVDERDLGPTPYSGYFHAQREYAIDLIPPVGYDFKRQILTVSEDMRNEMLTYSLAAQDVDMVVTAKPEQAHVSITGGPVSGENPYRVSPGFTYTVMAGAEGYHTRVKRADTTVGKTCEVLLGDLHSIGLGPLYDIYVPLDWPVCLRAPLSTDEDVTCLWVVGEETGLTEPMIKRSFRKKGVVPVSLTVTTKDTWRDHKTTACDIYIGESLRISDDRDDASPAWLDLESVVMSLVPKYNGASFLGYEAQVCFSVHEKLPERPEGDLAFFRVELTSQRGGVTITEAATMLWRPADPADDPDRTSSWATAWLVRQGGEWVSSPPVQSFNRPGSKVELSMLCPGLDPAGIRTWRAYTGTDPTLQTTLDEAPEGTWPAHQGGT